MSFSATDTLDSTDAQHGSNSSSPAHASTLPQHAVPLLPGGAADHIMLRAQQSSRNAAAIEATQAHLGMAEVVHTGNLIKQEEFAAARKRKCNPACWRCAALRLGSAASDVHHSGADSSCQPHR